MSKASPTAKLAALFGVGIAVYELLAVVWDVGPTVTALVESLPELAELVIILVFVAWLLDHFGWLHRLIKWLASLSDRLEQRD